MQIVLRLSLFERCGERRAARMLPLLRKCQARFQLHELLAPGDRGLQLEALAQLVFHHGDFRAQTGLLGFQAQTIVRDGDEIEYEYQEPRAVLAGLKVPAE